MLQRVAQRAAGLIQCTECGGFFRGERGLRNHWAYKHDRSYEEARASAASASTALVPFSSFSGADLTEVSPRYIAEI